MTYKQAIKIFEERRENMLNLMENKPSLPRKTQHQLTGAISELNVVLKTLQNLRDQAGSQERSFEIPESQILNKVIDLVDR